MSVKGDLRRAFRQRRRDKINRAAADAAIARRGAGRSDFRLYPQKGQGADCLPVGDYDLPVQQIATEDRVFAVEQGAAYE